MRIIELLTLSEDGPLRPRPPVSYRGCKETILGRLRQWIVGEEVRKFGRNPEAFERTQGYMMALSNLAEILQDIDAQVKCHVDTRIERA